LHHPKSTQNALEEQVEERTKELAHLNALLSAEIDERKRTEEQLRHFADEQAALIAVTSAASSFLEPDTLLSTILEVVMGIPGIHADAGWMLVLEEGRSAATRLGPVQGISRAYMDVEHAEPLHTCPSCRSWLQGSDLMSLPPINARLHLNPRLMEKAGIQSHITIPLSVSQRLLGVLTLGWQEHNEYILTDRTLLLSIGRQVGLALRNAQLYQSAIKVNSLEAINKIGAAAGSTLELDIVLQQVLEEACQTLDAETGTILLSSPDAKDLEFAYILPGSLSIESNQRIPAEQGIIGWVVQYRQVARINDIQRDPRTYRGLRPIFGSAIDSLICAPLVHRDKFTGVIVIVNKRAGEFTEEDANLLEAVSSIVASALDNARLYDDLKQSLVEKERAQAQLIQSEKIAALGRLAASVAHEINNPLQAVQGCLSLLSEELSGLQRPEKLSSYLNIVDKEIGRVAGIVQEMRDFARPAPSGTRPTDVISVLEDVLGLAGKQLQQSQVTVERSWGIDVPAIQANPNLLKQVFLNMILNAIDAMSGGGNLHISANVAQIKAADDQEPRSAVRVEFTDTGHGMSSQELSRLFEPFYTTKEHGSGLGLYISYTIIQSLGGKIEVSSTLGQGTTFTILLPLK
jgi:signal transduction histidine kinase